MVENKENTEVNYDEYLLAVYPIRCDLDTLMSCPNYKRGKADTLQMAADLLRGIRRIEAQMGVTREFSVYWHLKD